MRLFERLVWTTSRSCRAASRSRWLDREPYLGRVALVIRIPRPLPSRKSTAIHGDHTGSPPASTVEIKPAGEGVRTLDPYLGKVRFQFCTRRGRKRPLNDYFPPTSTGLNAEHTGLHADRTGVHADHKMANPRVGRGTVPMTVRQRRDYCRAKRSQPPASWTSCTWAPLRR